MGKEDDFCCVECGRKTPPIDMEGLKLPEIMELCRTNKCKTCLSYEDDDS